MVPDLHSMPAKQLLWAKNTLTQRAIGPLSYTSVNLDASRLKVGDEAGLLVLSIFRMLHWRVVKDGEGIKPKMLRPEYQ